MITSLTVSNFRSVGPDVRIQLGDMTALVGPNGSGKSNVVDSLRFLADVMDSGLPGAIGNRDGIKSVRRWSSGRPFNMALRAELQWESGSGAYAFELRGDSADEYVVKREVAEVAQDGEAHRFERRDGAWNAGPKDIRPAVDALNLALPLVGGDERFAPLRKELADIAVYTIFPDHLREPQKYSSVRPMSRHGENWASILRDESSRAWRPELVAVLRHLTGDIVDLEVGSAAGFLVVRFRHQFAAHGNGAAVTHRAKWFSAGQESDGTLRVAGIVTACLQEPAAAVLCVEEPELTVHPGAIPLLVDQLAQASRRSQVIVTTHSPELLALLDPGDVRVVFRRRGATDVAAMDPDQADAVRRGLLSLGDFLRTEGIQPELPFALTEG